MPTGERSLGFAGRRWDLAALEEALAAARQGRGTFVLVAGEPGIGKTRLCEEAAMLAREAGMAVAWAGCWESGSRPFWPWAHVLEQLGQPWPEPSQDGADPDLARRRLFDAVAGRLWGPHDRSLLVVLDDVHWADPPSVRLLAYLAPLVRTAPLVIVAAYRDVDAGAGSTLGDALPDLLATGRLLQLSGLGRDETEQLIGLATGERPGAAVADTVWRHTAGNPLFARELARLLAAEGRLVDLPAAAPAEVPATVRAVLTGRLARLSPECQEALILAAVVGEQFGLEVLAEIGGDDPSELIEVLDEAVATRIVKETGVGRYAFAHALVRATLYERLAIARRVRLHQRVGEALEALAARGHDVEPASLAHHFVQAAPGGGAAKAVDYAHRAAAAAASLLAHEDAAGLLGLALVALDLDPGAGERIPLLLELGDARLAAGDTPGARQAFLRAAELARDAGRPDQMAQAALGVAGGPGFEVGLSDPISVDLLEEALAGLPAEPSTLRARLTARLSVSLSLVASEKRRLALSEEAVALARASGDEAALAYALAAHCDTIAGPGDVERRLAEGTEIVELATARGDLRGELLGRRLRLVALLELGDMAGTDAEIGAFARTSGRLGEPSYGWYVPLWRGMRAAMRGELDEAARQLDEARELGARAHSDNAALLAMVQRWWLLHEAGEHDEARRLADEALPSDSLLGVQLATARMWTDALAGRTDDAAARLPELTELVTAAPVDSEWLPMLVQLAEVIAWSGETSMAPWAYEQLLPHRRLFAIEGIGAGTHGSVERHLGLLAAAQGHAERAAEHFEAAVGANRRTDAALLVAHTLRDAGVILGDQGRLTEALAAYRRLGVQARSRQLEAQPGGTASGAHDAIFRREGEVWNLSYAGRAVRVRDAKGLRDLAHLLAHPGREIAALDLAGVPGNLRRLGGDLGEGLDTTARQAYKARLVQLEDELEEADAAGDQGRSAQLAAERDVLVHELTAAYGLGGRRRRSGEAAERARTAVTARIRDALRRIESIHPELARHLRRSVRTGTFCAYEPENPVDWMR